jgi:hypothetical protein
MNSYFHRLIILGTFSIFVIVGRDVFRARQNWRSMPMPKYQRASGLHTVTKVTTVEVRVDDVASDRPHNSLLNKARLSPTSATHGAGYATNIESNLQPQSPRTSPDIIMNTTARSYLRCSLLFFIGLVVTWVWLSLNLAILAKHRTKVTNWLP